MAAGGEGWKAAMSCHCPLVSGAGLLVRNAAEVGLRNVRVAARHGPALDARGVRDLHVDDCRLTSDDTERAIRIAEAAT